LALHPVHHLEGPVAAATGIREEVEEVVGLVVEAERVEAPEPERGVADPGVAVVPVASAARRLRQRSGARGRERAGGGVGQALERQRAALQIAAPWVVGELAAVEPLAPVLLGLVEPPAGVLEVARQRLLVVAHPGERGVAALALFQERARLAAPPL